MHWLGGARPCPQNSVWSLGRGQTLPFILERRPFFSGPQISCYGECRSVGLAGASWPFGGGRGLKRWHFTKASRWESCHCHETVMTVTMHTMQALSALSE